MKVHTPSLKWIIPIGVLFILIMGISCWPRSTHDFELPSKVDFNYHIRPILSQNCYTCHGPDSSSRKGGLRLDAFEAATALLESGEAAIVPGKPGKSLLIKRIHTEDPDQMMPPPETKRNLSDYEKALLEKWIDQGAKWKAHWAYIKPEMPKLSKKLQGGPVSETIDFFIDQELKRKKLSPSPTASKESLIRRAAYILTGLPPSPADVQDFVQDEAPDAYEKMVDRYLASPHFGERWARHWMDLVRYGENMGHEFDFSISGSWQYRDYLIRAFNQDVPFDLFVKEHLAGDMLQKPRLNPEKGFNESLMGTAYFFLGEGKHSPVNIKLEEADRIDNIIDVTSKTFQAMTVSCARCHDHKFDPIPTTDYYAMYGMFESARIVPQPARQDPKQVAQIEKLKVLKKEIRSFLGKEMALASLKEAPNDLQYHSPESLFQLTQFINKQDPNAQQEVNDNYKLIGDFRDGSWEGWYTEGKAFGDGPLMGEPLIDSASKELVDLQTGIASSRAFATGIHGVLHSPNFIIEHDSIAVRAAGFNGTIRVIVDNFQIIQNPLYGSLEKVVNSPEMKTYIFDLDLVQGSKAYIEFLPGKFGRPRPAHVFHMGPEDYIEVEYAYAFSGKRPNMEKAPLAQSKPSFEAKKAAIVDWTQQKASKEQIHLLTDWLEDLPQQQNMDGIRDKLIEYDNIAATLYDSTHFIGLTEGEAVFSSVFIRGSVAQQSKEKVPRRFLTAVEAGADVFPQKGSGRLAWAEAVTDPNNPLTSRVIVNRLWHHIFGRGIVETVDNFGLQGQLPSHPALLDYLALKMIEDGWSLKSMIRNILLSQSFQRSTSSLNENQTKDPNNIYLHHFPVRRLEGEAIRDGMLAVSGRLDSSMYGKPISIHLTEFMTGRGRPRRSGPLDGDGRRSIYGEIRRNFLPPMMLVFDMPIPFSTFGKRLTTNVPAQSLTLMNDPFVLDQAQVWAKNLLEEGPADLSDRIQRLYQQAFARTATTAELEAAQAFLQNQAEIYDCSEEEMQNDLQIWADYCHTLFNLKEFIHLL